MEEKLEILGNDNNTFSEEEIISDIKKIIMNVIENNLPYKWISYTDPIYNDHSGIVEKIERSEFQQFVEGVLDGDYYAGYTQSNFEKLFNNIFIDEWIATYQSHYGKNWISYFDIIREKYDAWKYENFPLVLEEEDDIDLELDIKLDNIFYDFIGKLDEVEFYLKKILNTCEVNSELRK